jgi:hypothetical protein
MKGNRIVSALVRGAVAAVAAAGAAFLVTSLMDTANAGMTILQTSLTVFFIAAWISFRTSKKIQ